MFSPRFAFLFSLKLDDLLQPWAYVQMTILVTFDLFFAKVSKNGLKYPKKHDSLHKIVFLNSLSANPTKWSNTLNTVEWACDIVRVICILHTKIKKPWVNFIVKIFLIENECKTPYGSLFYDKMDTRLFYFHVTYSTWGY